MDGRTPTMVCASPALAQGLSTSASRSRLRLAPRSASPPPLTVLEGCRSISTMTSSACTSQCRRMHSTVVSSATPALASASAARPTCSTHGEKLHTQPPGRRAAAAASAARQGEGRSRKTPSARPSISAPNPSASTSRCVTCTTGSRPLFRNSSVARRTRSALNSNVRTRPCGATQRASAVVRLPLPVPLSITTQPGLSSSPASTTEMSGWYRICVRCGRIFVHSSEVGLSTCTKPLPLEAYTFRP
mmetsp:Transcript_20973/g.64978  ORF Transcript_20973/g.64978 Transcript_20973/m.64978 type:complete len:246 (+) Transcript_20973:266-1003(+)